jgi:hypothetical protein
MTDDADRQVREVLPEMYAAFHNCPEQVNRDAQYAVRGGQEALGGIPAGHGASRAARPAG